jgi:hypothetical protein
MQRFESRWVLARLLATSIFIVTNAGAQAADPGHANPPPTLAAPPAPEAAAKPVIAEAPASPAPASASKAPGARPDWVQQLQQPEPADEETSSFVDKGDTPYIDVVSAWGWNNNSYAFSASLFNFYGHDEGDTFGLHGRVLGLGAVSYELRRVRTDGTSSKDRKTRFVLDVVALQPRVYAADWCYFSFGLNLGAGFYDGFVPTADLNAGLGVAYRGWGLEVGARTNRLPAARTKINGEEFISTAYGGQLYLTIETNLSLFN